MTIGKIGPRGQQCRGAGHGAAGQHGSYRHITTQHIVHATGDSDYRRKFGIWVGGNMCLIIMKSQGFLYITCDILWHFLLVFAASNTESETPVPGQM